MDLFHFPHNWLYMYVASLKSGLYLGPGVVFQQQQTLGYDDLHGKIY